MATKTSRSKGFLSKTLFVMGLQCHKSLYLQKYNPELKDEISEEQEAKFEGGKEVHKLARELFPDGIEIEYDGISLSSQLARTQEEMKHDAKVLYEAAFSHAGLFAKVDILRLHKGMWQIYEVKASAKVKDHHVSDLAFQYYLLKGFGLPISKAFLVHIDTEYVRDGDIEVDKLFKVVDLTREVRGQQSSVKQELSKMRRALGGKKAPAIDIGEHCSKPYDCDFWGHCWKHIPDYSVFDIKNIRTKAFALYGEGFVRLQDVPLNRLTKPQIRQVECCVHKKNGINKNAVNTFLDSLWYPLCFLDFETTAMVAVPMFDGTRPYQEVPFQYSLHVQESPGAKTKHFMYLAPADGDPRRPFLEGLLEVLPEDGCILIYNKSFEKKILGFLKEWFPKHKRAIDGILGNIVDLMIPFQKMEVYSWKMKGSHSLKSVLPALVSDMSYDQMAISDGGMASSAWLNMRETDDRSTVRETRKALLEYCRMDTLGMVRILEKLREIS